VIMLNLQFTLVVGLIQFFGWTLSSSCKLCL
jgi:hypothetical protein